ncbi:MAG: LCP family protein [Ruminococcus sp.]|nr:LCP family protein [Ruminococcus sp.]
MSVIHKHDAENEIENTDNESTMNIPKIYPTPPPASQPNYNRPNYNQPNYNQPNYNQPNYNQPNYNQPNYNQPNYNQPNYNQPNYNQPNYNQPNYNQPNYNQPNYNQPNYNQPNPNYNNMKYNQSQTQNRSNSPKKKTAKSTPQKSKNSGKKKHLLPKPIRKLIAFLLTVLIILFVIYSVIVIGIIRNINYEPTGSRSRTQGSISSGAVTNILLIGTDSRTPDERGRADTTMLLSINSRTNQITLTSFMRDSYVNIPDYGWDKLNASYTDGGAELLMDTIERNFNLKIDNYILVNFISFAAIVDSVGGVDLSITDEEATEINNILMAEVNEIMGDDMFSDLLETGGNIHLNGKQALSYSRIRYVGNADFERTERQRKIMNIMLGKLETLRPSIMKEVAKNVMPTMTTNMSKFRLYLLSLKVPFLIRYDNEQLQIPADGTFYGDFTDSGDVLKVDFDTNYSILRSRIFAQ